MEELRDGLLVDRVEAQRGPQRRVGGEEVQDEGPGGEVGRGGRWGQAEDGEGGRGGLEVVEEAERFVAEERGGVRGDGVGVQVGGEEVGGQEAAPEEREEALQLQVVDDGAVEEEQAQREKRRGAKLQEMQRFTEAIGARGGLAGLGRRGVW